MYRQASNRPRKMLVAIFAGIVPVVLACGGGAADEAADAPPVCATPIDSVHGGALEKFIATRNPIPHRFLIAMGTDSLVPEGAHYVMNLLGRAMYVWPSDPAQQKDQIANMRARGGYVTMAIFYHGMKDLPDGLKSFEYSALYVDRANDGARVARTSILFNCQAPDGSRFTAGDEVPPPAGGGGGGAPAPAGGGGYD